MAVELVEIDEIGEDERPVARARRGFGRRLEEHGVAVALTSSLIPQCVKMSLAQSSRPDFLSDLALSY
jgi:hypothetical protein